MLVNIEIILDECQRMLYTGIAPHIYSFLPFVLYSKTKCFISPLPGKTPLTRIQLFA
jgi:hypothetical protein